MELSRDGPGLLLRDMLKGEDPQIAAAMAVLADTRPDIVLLTGIDLDPGGATLSALQSALAAAELPFSYAFAPPGNAGAPSGVDLDGDGRLGTARDALGYGRFRGDGAMALLSRYPILADEAQDFTDLLWRDLPGAEPPLDADGGPFPSAEAAAIRRLSSVGHWAVPIAGPGGARLIVLCYSATPPVFDGPEDLNGRRAADESRFWLSWLAGDLGPVPDRPVVLLGRANLDPFDGDGPRAAIRNLLESARLQDPAPASAGARAARDPEHRGDPGQDTVEWRAMAKGGPGNLRVDYVLPDADLAVTGAGVHWPKGPAQTVRAASRGRLVWVDVAWPPAGSDGD